MIEKKNVCACLCVRVFRLINVKMTCVMLNDMTLSQITNLLKLRICEGR